MGIVKKITLVFILIFGVKSLFAQTIDRSQYEGITLFDYQLWSNQQNYNIQDKKFKATVYFRTTSGTYMMFTDEVGLNEVMAFQITRRWASLERGQRVTIFFTAHISFPIIDDIDYGSSTAIDVRPWQRYIDDGNAGKTGWFLKSLGNGRYEEVYY